MIKSISVILITLYAIIFLSGCTAGLMDPEIDFEPPVYVEQIPAKEERQDFSATGSIFGQGDNPLFSDHKAMHVHDIVQVVISENAQSSNVSSKKLSKVDESDLNAGVFSSPNGVPKSTIGALGGLGGGVGFNSGSTSTFDGSGSATKDASFSATISARIVKVLSNGNYFISGKREILIDDQKQIIQLSGVIRPYDIDQNNQIDSSQMSDAKILYKTQGDVDRAGQQGWGSKIMQSVWPF